MTTTIDDPRRAAVPPELPNTTPRARPRRRFDVREHLLFVAMVAPNLFLLAVFTYRPLVETIRLSFYRWDLISPSKAFVGLENYREYLSDSTSQKIVITTLIFTTCTVVGSMVLGLGLALLLNRSMRGRSIVRAVLFAPYVVSGAAVGIVWLFVFDPKFGMISALLQSIGIDSPNWYNAPRWALAMVILVYIWKNLGYATLVYLAGLQAIPRDLYEAAEIDGAGRWATLRAVTVPQLSSTTFFLSVTTFLSSMQAFDIIHVMTRGGPLDGTKTMVYQVYDEAFVRFRVGLASTIATVLFVVLFIVTLAQVRFVERRVAYS